MFESKKEETQFPVKQDKNLFLGILGSALRGGCGSDRQNKTIDKIEARRQNRLIKTTAAERQNSSHLIVFKPVRDTRTIQKLLFVGMSYCQRGFMPSDSDLHILKKYRPDWHYVLLDEWWSDGLFSSQFVRYAFRSQTFGGINLKAVREEQARAGVTSNRDGLANGRTWADQQSEAERSGSRWQTGEAHGRPGMLLDPMGGHKAFSTPEGTLDGRSGKVGFSSKWEPN